VPTLCVAVHWPFTFWVENWHTGVSWCGECSHQFCFSRPFLFWIKSLHLINLRDGRVRFEVHENLRWCMYASVITRKLKWIVTLFLRDISNSHLFYFCSYVKLLQSCIYSKSRIAIVQCKNALLTRVCLNVLMCFQVRFDWPSFREVDVTWAYHRQHRSHQISTHWPSCNISR